DIEASLLVRIAQQDRLVGRRLIGRVAPFERLRRQDFDGGRIELGGGQGRRQGCKQNGARCCQRSASARSVHLAVLPWSLGSTLQTDYPLGWTWQGGHNEKRAKEETDERREAGPVACSQPRAGGCRAAGGAGGHRRQGRAQKSRRG